MSSEREKYLVKNSLVCLLVALEGKETAIELRNENVVTGKIENVDAFMNVTMSDALLETYKGDSTEFTSFFVQGVNIRYVHIPDDVNIRRAIEKELGIRQKMADKARRDVREAALNKIQRKEREQEKVEKLKELRRNQEQKEKK